VPLGYWDRRMMKMKFCPIYEPGIK